jgi:hypothetical protein
VKRSHRIDYYNYEARVELEGRDLVTGDGFTGQLPAGEVAVIRLLAP